MKICVSAVPECIQACPVDAIVGGTTKALHTVIKDECAGCDLCVAPCLRLYRNDSVPP